MQTGGSALSNTNSRQLQYYYTYVGIYVIISWIRSTFQFGYQDNNVYHYYIHIYISEKLYVQLSLVYCYSFHVCIHGYICMAIDNIPAMYIAS